VALLVVVAEDRSRSCCNLTMRSSRPLPTGHHEPGVETTRLTRRQGVGRHLLEAIVAAAPGAFHELRLRTDSEQAARFYERFGFRRINGEASTHALTIEAKNAPVRA
jgi:GNAT superfamily N-acetyltransferase